MRERVACLVGFKTTQPLFDAIVELAKRHNTNQSGLMRAALSDYLMKKDPALAFEIMRHHKIPPSNTLVERFTLDE
jgi:hypothetical protein